MKKIDRLTVIAVILALAIAYLLLPTEIGVNLKVEGNAPVYENVQTPTQAATQPTVQQTTVPATAPSAEAEKPQESTPDSEKTESGKPESVEEIIDQYTLLVDKFKKEKPAYTKKEYQALPEEYRNFGGPINTVLNIASGYMVSEEDAEELVRQPGAEEILTDVPIHNSEKGCALTDYDAVEWAKCEDLGDGTYKISFSLKEEINAEPTPADTLIPPSAHGAVMQPMAFKDIKTEVDNIVAKVPGVSVNRFELIYRECVFSCIYNPETDELVSITHNIVIDIAANAKAFTAEIDGTARLTNDMFIYNITW